VKHRCMLATLVLSISQKTVVGDIMARRGRLDVLMTAAGFSCGGTVLTTDPADWGRGVPHQYRWHMAVVARGAARDAAAGPLARSSRSPRNWRSPAAANNSAYIAAKGRDHQPDQDHGTRFLQPTAYASNAIRAGRYRQRRCCVAVLPVTRIPNRCAKASRNRHGHEAIWQSRRSGRGPRFILPAMRRPLRQAP